MRHTHTQNNNDNKCMEYSHKKKNNQNLHSIKHLKFIESPSKDDREKVNDQILRNYLTAAQIKRLHIFTRYFEPEARPYDVKVLLVSLFKSTN